MEENPSSVPVERNRRLAGKWIARILLFLVAWAVIFFFLLGPGRVLFPSLLISYSSVSDKTNTVYYSGHRIEQAMDVLWMAAVVQDSIRRFWNDSTTRDFWKGVNIFICESPGQYYYLTWNRAMGSALMGRIVLNPARYGPNMSLYSALVHEMSHLYISRRYGYLSYVFLIPKWFDEGCATLMQEFSFAESHLESYLRESPGLVSLSALKHPWDWQTMVSMEEGKMAAKGYGHVSSFMEELRTRYGIDRIRDYAGHLGLNLLPGNTFRRIYGISLHEADVQWLENKKKEGILPEETVFIPLAFSFPVFLRWVIISGIFAASAFLLLRWVIRLFRRRH